MISGSGAITALGLRARRAEGSLASHGSILRQIDEAVNKRHQRAAANHVTKSHRNEVAKKPANTNAAPVLQRANVDQMHVGYQVFEAQPRERRNWTNNVLNLLSNRMRRKAHVPSGKLVYCIALRANRLQPANTPSVNIGSSAILVFLIPTSSTSSAIIVRQ